MVFKCLNPVFSDHEGVCVEQCRGDQDCAAGEKCISSGCDHLCSRAPRGGKAERPARIPQLNSSMLGPAQPSNCFTHTPNSSNSYLIPGSLSTTYYLLSPFRCVPLCAAPWAVTCQAPLSAGFSRQEYWRGLPCLTRPRFAISPVLGLADNPSLVDSSGGSHGSDVPSLHQPPHCCLQISAQRQTSHCSGGV